MLSAIDMVFHRNSFFYASRGLENSLVFPDSLLSGIIQHMSEVRSRVVDLLRRLGHSSADQPGNAPILSNSLALIEAVVALESEFGIRFTLAEIHEADFFEVTKLTQVIEAKLVDHKNPRK